MKPHLRALNPNSIDKPAGPDFEANILRLVKGVRECRAIQAGQVDAIIDPASGRVLLLPEAQAALLERRTQFRSLDVLRRSEARLRRLLELSTDWYWEQDSQFRFTKTAGVGMVGTGDILGKTLWELPAVMVSDEEWVKHKSELAARWSFCDFACAAVLPNGQRRDYHISGEPLYDEAGAFIGFHGTGVDVTRWKRAGILT